ncbi:3-hydroxyacyl-CoA dehydrogenase NAD-binding domain-containing protein, partial [Crocinitomicaceae bacterium]|nr:3-hydroxyacyl-CoA dehydrogenase NAD-binding domain-containing protein [Crocinitomicaceae bacterium]
MKNVAVIGAGTMGNGIAHTFAQFGYNVSLIDVQFASLEKGLATIEKNLDRQVAKEKITEAQKTETLANISTYTDMEAGVKGVDLVVEAATENVDLKLQIFKNLCEVTPTSVILATNTSSISITKIAAVTDRPDKVI